MKIDILRMSQVGNGQLNRWRELQAAQPETRNAFLSPEFAQHVDAAGMDVEVAISTDSRTDHFAVLPFQRMGMDAYPVGWPAADFNAVLTTNAEKLPLVEMIESSGVRCFRFDHLVDPHGLLSAYSFAQETSPYICLQKGFEWYAASKHNSG
ncbi:MAG: hypothetical protein AAF483_27905, partial [Planctomycetota bacterium]